MDADTHDEVLDDEAWAEGECFWRALVEEILTSMGEPGTWPTWEPKFYGDGVTPLPREYQAICDGRSWRLDRSFAIRELPGSGRRMSARVKDYLAEMLDFPDINSLEDAERWYEDVPARERVPKATLLITLERSKPTVARARALSRCGSGRRRPPMRWNISSTEVLA